MPFTVTFFPERKMKLSPLTQEKDIWVRKQHHQEREEWTLYKLVTSALMKQAVTLGSAGKRWPQRGWLGMDPGSPDTRKGCPRRSSVLVRKADNQATPQSSEQKPRALDRRDPPPTYLGLP